MVISLIRTKNIYGYWLLKIWTHELYKSDNLVDTYTSNVTPTEKPIGQNNTYKINNSG